MAIEAAAFDAGLRSVAIVFIECGLLFPILAGDSLLFSVGLFIARGDIDVNIVAQAGGTFAANNGAGRFDWDLTGRGMRGDIDGYLAEFHPAAPVYKIWYPEYRNVKAWRGIGNGRIQLDPDKRLPIYKASQRELLLNPVQIPLVAIKKYQVVRKRVQGMYVAFSDFNTGLRDTVWLSS